MNIPYPAVVSHHFTLYTHGRLQGVQKYQNFRQAEERRIFWKIMKLFIEQRRLLGELDVVVFHAGNAHQRFDGDA
jgi:hypothetical protein